jgi:hypothetical protein
MAIDFKKIFLYYIKYEGNHPFLRKESKEKIPNIDHVEGDGLAEE